MERLDVGPNFFDQTLPLEFDSNFYVKTYPELGGMTEAELREHYEKHGRQEGRFATPAVPRYNFIPLVPPNCRILEIGPGDNPGFVGPNVRYFDVVGPENLRNRAVVNGQDPNKVPQTIHYIAPTSELANIPETFDIVYSSHVIEHQPDLVRHLNAVEQLLVPSGAYFIICPDKRFCFDAPIPESFIADVIEAYLMERKVHSIRTVVSMWLTAHNDSRMHWRTGPIQNSVNLEALKTGIQVYQDSKGGYVDAHAWRFTPLIFRQIIESLNALSLVKLRPMRVYDTPYQWNEFSAVLVKS